MSHHTHFQGCDLSSPPAPTCISGSCTITMEVEKAWVREINKARAVCNDRYKMRTNVINCPTIFLLQVIESSSLIQNSIHGCPPPVNGSKSVAIFTLHLCIATSATIVWIYLRTREFQFAPGVHWTYVDPDFCLSCTHCLHTLHLNTSSHVSSALGFAVLLYLPWLLDWQEQCQRILRLFSSSS